jgi:isopenicillin N synthase-like dioxygenase
VALGLEPGWLRSRTDDPFWTLGLNWYPPVTVVGSPQPGQFRIGPHTDFGVLTILDREVGMGGLQVQRDDGTWEDAPFVAGALTINLGDLMARWTGDRWRSARHRVLPPPTWVDESLLSLVFFDEGNLDELVETLPAPAAGPTQYEPIRAADYLRLKLGQISV